MSRYIDLIADYKELKQINNNVENYPILVFTLPHLVKKIEKNAYRKDILTRYSIFNLFIHKYMKTQYDYYTKNDLNV